ncbi:AsmA family protein [Acidisoma cellulosilytica]|uniref:AsmA family protein n=1 Tax=Acidisoma cellulosilyticum TaxID=2802395 RepID=A0A963YZY1_9PROT|nr:AsmA-like C-terminal region-containing protein [Acidisoma cellulosilyticum]MCB8879984.1 AsmA family protein [Acidisoma cellulosilyticum]
MRAPAPLTPREPRRPHHAPRLARRSRRGRLFGLVVVALGLLFALLWFGPRLADWSAHRAAVQAVASEILGRDVQINGEIHLILLPQPSITAEQVKVNDGGDGVRMTTGSLVLNLSLGALVTGRIAVTHVELDRPDIRLPWPLPGGPDAIEPPPWLAALSADVTHGTFTFGTLRVTDADFSVVTGGADDALAVDGTAKAGGRPWQVDMHLSWPSSDGNAGVHLTLATTAAPDTKLDLKGMLNEDGQLSGQFTAHGADLSAFVAAPPVGFDGQGQLLADGLTIHLMDVAATLGSMATTGDVLLRLDGPKAARTSTPRLSVDLHTPQLNLAPWLKAFPAASSHGLPLTLSLDADAAMYGDGLLRHFGVKLSTSPTRLRLDALTAVLPGEAGLSLTGYYDPQGLGFSGRVQLSAPSPLVTLHWLAQTGLLPDLSNALSGLNSLAIDSRLDAIPGQIALTEIDGLMNDTTMTGGMVLTTGKPAHISAGLSFARIDLGQWLPAAWLIDPPRPDALARQLYGINADLQLSADEVWVGGDRLDHALLDAAIDNGALNLRQFAAQDDGMQILSSGAMDAKGTIASGRLVLTAPHATPIVDLLPAPLRDLNTDVWSQPLTTTVTASGPTAALALNLQGSLGDLGFSAQPVLDLVHDRWQGAVTLQHPSARRLMTALGFGQSENWLGEGSLSVVANAASDGVNWSISPLTFSAGLIHGSGHLAHQVQGPPEERRVTGALDFASLPLPHPDTEDPLPLDLFQGWNATLDVSVGAITDDLTPIARAIRANLDVSDGVLRLALERASFLGGNAFGAVKLTMADPPQAEADLGLQAAQVGQVGALPSWVPDGSKVKNLSGQLTLTAHGYSLASWLASLAGKFGFTAGSGSLPGLTLAAAGTKPALSEAALSKALFQGATPFDQATGVATLSQGELAIDSFGISGSAGTLDAAGQVDLVRGVCNLDLTLKPAGAAPAAAVLRGPLRDPAAWMVGTPPG